MKFSRLAFSRRWTRPEDFPTVESDETQVRQDMQCLHDETRDGLNRLADELEEQRAAAGLGAVDREGMAGTVQKVFDWLYGLFANITGVATELGADDSTIPTSKAVSDAIRFSGVLPAGGKAGQALVKAGTANYETVWQGVARDRVGDVRTTVRTDLGDNWALCSGMAVDEKTVPQLWPMLAEEPERVLVLEQVPRSTGRQTKPIYGRHAIDISCIGSSYDGTESGAGFGYYDLDESRAVWAENMDAGEGTILGLDWNGEQWVACLIRESRAIFFTSPDMKNWTPAGETAELGVSLDTGGGEPRFLFDGAAYRLLCRKFVTITADFQAANIEEVGDYAAMRYANGYVFLCFNQQESGGKVYGAGKTEAVTTGTMDGRAIPVVYDENRVLLLPGNGTYGYVSVFNTVGKGLSALSMSAAFNADYGCSCRPAYYDAQTEELVLLLCDWGYFEDRVGYSYLRLKWGSDPTKAASYRVDGSPNQDECIGAGMLDEDMQMYCLSGQTLYTCGTTRRALPMIDVDGARCYVKVRDEE